MLYLVEIANRSAVRNTRSVNRSVVSAVPVLIYLKKLLSSAQIYLFFEASVGTILACLATSPSSREELNPWML